MEKILLLNIQTGLLFANKFLHLIYTRLSKVKYVYNDHPWEPKLVDVGDRWSLFRGH